MTDDDNDDVFLRHPERGQVLPIHGVPVLEEVQDGPEGVADVYGGLCKLHAAVAAVIVAL